MDKICQKEGGKGGGDSLLIYELAATVHFVKSKYSSKREKKQRCDRKGI